MNKKRPNPHTQIQPQDEVTVFLDRVLQWLCVLQSRDVELFEEQRLDLIQIPNVLPDRHVEGRHELGGEVTVLTQLFGEV